MAKRIDEENDRVSFTFENTQIDAQTGDTVAAALAAAEQRYLRDSVVTAEPRGFYCMMGTCFECLVVIDGKPNIQACQTMVREGMEVSRQTRLEIIHG